jgi:Rha family phage regulatory protein
MTDSLKLAEMLEKRHDRVLRDIKFLDCNEDFRKNNFKKSNYVNSQNKIQPKYNITESGFKFLVASYRGPKARKIRKSLGLIPANDDIEGKYLEIISDSFSHLRQEFQKTVGAYRIDLYFPDINVAVEIDEYHHVHQIKNDETRESYIKTVLGCEFLRFHTQGTSSIGVVINQIIKLEKGRKYE